MHGGGGRVVVWFRNDLRLHDNPVLHQAAQQVASGRATEVVPLYCFDPRNYITTPWGNPKHGSWRAKFVLEAVLELQKSLQAIDSDLLIRNGKPEDVIAEVLRDGGGPAVVLTGLEVTSEEERVDAKVRRAVKAAGGELRSVWGASLHHVEDLPFRSDLQDMPNLFTAFRGKVESNCKVRELLPTPGKGSLPLPPGYREAMAATAFAPSRVEDLNVVVPEGGIQLHTPSPHAQAVLDMRGGESEALKRLQHYTWGSDAIATYFETRNTMLGPDASTKFSAWLALGCMSPRTIFHEVKKYEAQRTANKSTYWVIFELLWRDYWRFFAMKHGNKIFMEGGTVGKAPRWDYNDDVFDRWREGRTGLPLVDANMRELMLTGYMSNRGRQNVASYLALELYQDWRLGADWFESQLVDYDVCSNWGNWVAAAGLTGGRVNQFNIIKQSRDYDPEGEYIKAWVPELAGVPAPQVFEPWKMSPQEQERYGVVIGKDYPTPIPGTRYTGSGGGHHAGGREGHYGSQQQHHRRGGGRGGRGSGSRDHSNKQRFRAQSAFDQYG